MDLIEDIGKIISGNFEIEGGGSLLLQTTKKYYLITTKTSYVIVTGTCNVAVYKTWKPKYEYERECNCNDPRVIFMYLYPFWRKQHKFKIGKIPIPTMEEAIEWMREADIPVRRSLDKGYRNGGNYTKEQCEFFNLPEYLQ